MPPSPLKALGVLWFSTEDDGENKSRAMAVAEPDDVRAMADPAVGAADSPSKSESTFAEESPGTFRLAVLANGSTALGGADVVVEKVSLSSKKDDDIAAVGAKAGVGETGADPKRSSSILNADWAGAVLLLKAKLSTEESASPNRFCAADG